MRKKIFFITIYFLSAYSAYGIAAQENYFPALAYDSMNNRYLVVYEQFNVGVKGDIYGQLLNADGTAYGSEISISTATNDQYTPSVAYDSGNGRFLVAWDDERNGNANSDIYGQLVNANGSLNGPNFPISTAANDQWSPSAA
jgi:cation diffusion facilitator CzcD-associated flavoprotein CzcO